MDLNTRSELAGHVLCLPRYCGFNDVLCQIWVSYQYAQNWERELWIDTRCSGLADEFAHYMHLYNPSRENSTITHTKIFNIEYEKLNRLKCYPNIPLGTLDQLGHYFMSSMLAAGLQHNTKHNIFLRLINLIKYTCNPKKEFPSFRIFSVIQLYTYLKKNKIAFIDRQFRNESMTIHASSGGGLESLQMLKLLRLNKNIRNQILTKLKDLPHDYDAIHIRHTDYQTDYQTFIQSINSELAGRTVLICSDNPDVLKFAKENLKLSKVICVTKVDQLSTDPSSHRPAHYQWHLPLNHRRNRNVSMLAELVGLSKSTRLFFTIVKKDGQEGHSGFSQLADGLRKNPDILANWLGPN